MMNVKQGKVVLNGKEFICTYGETLDLKRYYFVVGGELPNGNRIVTLNVSEALNQTGGVIRTLGLIDKEGTILVPLENKTVNTIDGKYIIFEKTTPSPDEVINMNAIKQDPVRAAKFTEDTFRIKEKMRAIAGLGAMDVYSNPEGSASVYTFDGKSIVDGKYYNYIVKGNKGFAFATSRSEEIKSVGDTMNELKLDIPVVDEKSERIINVPVQNNQVPRTEEKTELTIDVPQQNLESNINNQGQNEESKDKPVINLEKQGGEKKMEEEPIIQVPPEVSPKVADRQEKEESTKKDNFEENGEEGGSSFPIPEEPKEQEEKSEKDKILDEAAEVIGLQNKKIRELTQMIKDQIKMIDEKNKQEESLNKTIDEQTEMIANLEYEKRNLEVENARINVGIVNLQDVVKDAIEVLEDNDIEDVYVKTKELRKK